MNVKELVDWANDYADADGVSPAEAMLSVLIELYTSDLLDDGESIDAETFRRAWDRITRECSVSDWLEQAQALADGVDALAAILCEVGRDDLATDLRDLSALRFEGAARSPDLDLNRIRRSQGSGAPTPDNRLWVPRPSVDLSARRV